MRALELAVVAALVAAVVAALLCAAGPAHAYVTEKGQGGKDLRWSTLPMKYNVHDRAAPGLTATQTQAAVGAAYQTWATVSCSSFAVQSLGVVNLPGGNSNDSVNTNVWLSSWPSNYSSSTLGITLTYFNPSTGQLMDADTKYNPNYSWGIDGGLSKIDAQSVATHEIGHQLGLDHSSIQSATMFYATGQGDTSQRSLDADDIAGVCYLYPSGSAPPPECVTANDCAPNETCSGSKCVPSTSSGKGYGGPCSASQDCQSGICLQSGNNTFCSVGCVSSACPNGDQCVAVTGGSLTKACLPNSANRGTQDLGDPCQESLDCTSQICVNVPGQGYLCSQECSTTLDDCPSGFTCAPATTGGLCIPSTTSPPPSGCDPSKNDCPTGYACDAASKTCEKQTTPPGHGGFGDPCNQHSDCDSNLCIETPGRDGALVKYCTLLCVLGQQPCVSGYTCSDAGGGKAVCAISQGESGGCSVVTAVHGDRMVLPLLVLLLLSLLTLRSRPR